MKEKTAKKILDNIRFGQTRNASRVNKGQGLTVKKIDISVKDILRKYEEQDGKCYWSNLALKEEFNYIKRHPFAISVDRLNNDIGYKYDNTVLSIRMFNLGRGSYDGDFESIMSDLFGQITLLEN